MDWFPVFLSIKVALAASALTALIGLPLALVFQRKSFPGKDFFEAILLLPLVLPPSVLGYMLLMFFGTRGPMGKLLSSMGIQIIFTVAAAVIAAAVVALPLFYQSAKAALAGVDTNVEAAARTLGASPIRVFGTITLPLAFPGLAAGLVLAFTRALGEFGATMMVAGNIPGKTQTIPLAIFFAVDAGYYDVARNLVIIVTIFSYAVIFWSNRFNRKKAGAAMAPIKPSPPPPER